MAKGFKAQHFEDYSIVKGNIKIKLNLKQYEDKLQKAQYCLDGEIMKDMEQYMPMQAGSFIQTTKARSTALQGTGKVCAGAPPMGRFLYGGKVMIGEKSKSPWAMEGEIKVLTDRDLDFSKASHPEVTAQWFETAKKNHKDDWVKGVEKILTGE